jgi:hypothetical protein
LLSHGFDEFSSAKFEQFALTEGVAGHACAHTHTGGAICDMRVPDT